MTVLAVLFILSALVLGVAVVRARRALARVAFTICALSYCGFVALLILGSLRV